MDDATFKLIDGLLVTNRDHRQTAIECMNIGGKSGSIEGWSEIIGHRFCLNPKAIIEWYNERKRRLL